MTLMSDPLCLSIATPVHPDVNTQPELHPRPRVSTSRSIRATAAPGNVERTR